MNVNTTPNAARGEATITIGGEKHTIRFGMNVMRDVTKLTGRGTAEFAQLVSTDFNEAATVLVACAVKRHVPGKENFSQDDAGDLIDGLSVVENDGLAEAMKESIGMGPLMAALTAKVSAKNSLEKPNLPNENGTSTSTSLSVN